MPNNRSRVLYEISGDLRIEARPRKHTSANLVGILDDQNRTIISREAPITQTETIYREIDKVRQQLTLARSNLSQMVTERFFSSNPDRQPSPPDRSKRLEPLRKLTHILPPFVAITITIAADTILPQITGSPFTGAWITILFTAAVFSARRLDPSTLQSHFHNASSDDDTARVPILDVSRRSAKALPKGLLRLTAYSIAGVVLTTIANVTRISLADGPNTSASLLSFSLSTLGLTYYLAFEFVRRLIGKPSQANVQKLETGATWTPKLSPRATLIQIQPIDGLAHPVPAIAFDNELRQPVLYLTPLDGVSLWTTLDVASEILHQAQATLNAANQLTAIEAAMTKLHP